jgi:hypothetical protein
MVKVFSQSGHPIFSDGDKFFIFTDEPKMLTFTELWKAISWALFNRGFNEEVKLSAQRKETRIFPADYI